MGKKLIFKTEVKGREFPNMIRDFVIEKFKQHKRLMKALTDDESECTVNLGLYTTIHTDGDKESTINNFHDLTAIVEIYEESPYTNGLRDRK